MRENSPNQVQPGQPPPGEAGVDPPSEAWLDPNFVRRSAVGIGENKFINNQPKAVKKMNEIMKVSDISYQDVAEYLRLYEVDNDDINTLNTLINVAKAFISNYTGRSSDELDNYQDFVIVVFVLCQDMWDNRTLYVDSKNLNNVIETILGMHSVNLL